MSNYQNACEDAKGTAKNFLDEIVRQLHIRATSKASDDLYNDYPNGNVWLHKYHGERLYSLTDAAELLDELAAYEETGSSLWDGMLPCQAVCAQAAYTYRNAVMSMWQDLIAEINDSYGEWVDEWETKIFEGEGLLKREARKIKDARIAVQQWIDEY